MDITRRQATTITLAGLALTVSNTSYAALATAQSSPVRIPLSKFVRDSGKMATLRKGVRAMKKRKTSDPLSWNFQAAIHGIPVQMVAQFAVSDPGVANVRQQLYWNQCPHNGQNSANFLPWHRAYTHYFEKILRMHTEDDNFALPYWDYDTLGYLDFPKEYGVQHLDGNESNNDEANINPLYCEQRDYYLCSYEPKVRNLPLTQLSSRAVDSSRALAAPMFFGDTESTGLGGGIADDDPSTRGLLEQSPHDQIHRSVGGIVTGTDDQQMPITAYGWMAVPPTAGFDPIFCVHHANIDRLWAKWACMLGKSWGKLADQAWFDEAPWYFFDTEGRIMNLPRKTYFDHRALGIRFSDEDLSITPLQLPASILSAQSLMAMSMNAPSHPRSSLTVDSGNAIVAPVSGVTSVQLSASSGSTKHHRKNGELAFTNLTNLDLVAETVQVTLNDVDIQDVNAAGYDVHLVPDGAEQSALSPQSPTYLGPISLFNHSGMHGMSSRFNQTFDATPVLRALKRSSISGLHLVLVPYALVAPRPGATILRKTTTGTLTASGVSITRLLH